MAGRHTALPQADPRLRSQPEHKHEFESITIVSNKNQHSLLPPPTDQLWNYCFKKSIKWPYTEVTDVWGWSTGSKVQGQGHTCCLPYQSQKVLRSWLVSIMDKLLNRPSKYSLGVEWLLTFPAGNLIKHPEGGTKSKAKWLKKKWEYTKTRCKLTSKK